MDIAGLNTVYNIAAAGDEQGKANARYIKEHYIDQGKLGTSKRRRLLQIRHSAAGSCADPIEMTGSRPP